MWVPEYDRVDIAPSRESAVFQALGSASMCWEKVDKAGVFDSAKVKEIGDGLVLFLDRTDKPNLGLATTRELLDELTARAEVHGYANYKTVEN